MSIIALNPIKQIEQTCLFCLDGKNDDLEQNRELYKNSICPCNYNYHSECYDKFVIEGVYNCPLCRTRFRIQNNSLLILPTQTTQTTQIIPSPTPSQFDICKIMINILFCLVILIMFILILLSYILHSKA